ncbi:hypothetical protein BDV26DRAFT_256368 [Aspergillus bertholletiae]|uniref:Uncharacterized protein n=1 Tax=Aspergillus bertholletiae TaxID=1226010 RepID=A0A5N7BGX9_9EURO|nr:hypothetical protein BDV26DRAFT_256368 [Aspergillus bertholletiae]
MRCGEGRICSPRYRSIHTVSAIFPAGCSCCIPYLTVRLVVSTDLQIDQQGCSHYWTMGHHSGQPPCGTLTAFPPPIGSLLKPRPRVRSFQEPCHHLSMRSFANTVQVDRRCERLHANWIERRPHFKVWAKVNDDLGQPGSLASLA